MDSTLGMMGTAYEYVVTPKATGALRMKKLLFIALYILWGGGLLILGSTVGKLFLPLLAFVPVSLWILIWLTWKYTQVSYEYAFESGTLKVNRLLGERTRRPIVEVEIRDIQKCYPNTEESREEIATLYADREIFVASSKDSERSIAILWNDEDQKKNVLWFEPDEKALKILHRYNSIVF
jgi:hypothetical protein